MLIDHNTTRRWNQQDNNLESNSLNIGEYLFLKKLPHWKFY